MRHEPILARRTSAIARSEIVAAFTFALDLTEGQPQGHSIRACFIASELAREIGLTGDDWSAVYYATLLKDLGCSSNAARIHELYKADDLSFKANWKTVAPGLASPPCVSCSRTLRKAPRSRRGSRLSAIS